MPASEVQQYCLFVSLKSPWLFEHYKLMEFWLNTKGFSYLHGFYERYKLSRTKVLEVGKVGFGGGKVLGCYWGPRIVGGEGHVVR